MIPLANIPMVGEVCRGRIVTLGWPGDADYDCLTALRNRPITRRWFLDDREISAEASRRWMRELPGPYDALLVIRRSVCGTFLGSIGWTNLDICAGTATFGRLAIDWRALRRLVRSKSAPAAIAVDAATALRDFAFAEMRLRSLDTWYASDNALAAKVNTTVGMVITGSDSLARPNGQRLPITRAILTRERWLEVTGRPMGEIDRRVPRPASHILTDTYRRLRRVAGTLGLQSMSLIEKSAAAALFRSVGRDGSASAVKVLTAPDGDPSLHRRTVVLRREARYLAASRSPYIPRLVAVDDRGLWLAREFIAGRTLETACQSSSTVDRLEVLRQVSIMTQDLFTRFHEYKGGAHVLRDFKPRNIVLDENCPRAVCVDLGGVAAEGTAARAEDGKIRLGTGKWRFWAPEQLTNAEHVGRQADYFAYASIVFFILKGRPVLRNALADRASARCGFLDDYEEAMRDLQSSRHVGLNESFVEFLAACLQPDPHARPTAFPALDFDQCPR